MRKFTRIQKRLLTIIVVLCILACAMFGLRQNSITNIGYSAWTYLKYGLIQYPLSSIGNAVNDFSNLWHARDTYFSQYFWQSTLRHLQQFSSQDSSPQTWCCTCCLTNLQSFFFVISYICSFPADSNRYLNYIMSARRSHCKSKLDFFSHFQLSKYRFNF